MHIKQLTQTHIIYFTPQLFKVLTVGCSEGHTGNSNSAHTHNFSIVFQFYVITLPIATVSNKNTEICFARVDQTSQNIQKKKTALCHGDGYCLHF